MIGIAGIESTRQIVEEHPEAAGLIVTILDDDTMLAAVPAGARLPDQRCAR